MDDLDTGLSRSVPATSEPTPERDHALQAMVTAARARRRPHPRAGAAVIGGLALLGVGGAAAADALGWTVPWADDPVSDVSYTLPSGATCTGIVGGFWGGPSEIEAAEAVMTRPDLIETLDVERYFRELRSASHIVTFADGTEADAGPGTPYWSDDEAYENAVLEAANAAIHEELNARGLGTSGLLRWESEIRCPDAVVPELASDGVTRIAP